MANPLLRKFYNDAEATRRIELAEVVAGIREREGDHEGAERMRRNAALMKRPPPPDYPTYEEW